MGDVDTKLREILRDLADQAPTGSLLPPPVKRGIRRTRVVNAIVATGTAAALVIGAVVGITTLVRSGRPSTVRPAGTGLTSPVPWTGLFPADTQERGEQLQACADAGDAGCTGYLDLKNVLLSYGKRVWNAEVSFNGTVDPSDPDASGPLTVTIGQCQPTDGSFPPGCTVADVTAERLLRHDRTGIWFVTAVHEYTTGTAEDVAKAQAKAFVSKFMTFRLKQLPGAVDFLSAQAKDAYDQGVGGLFLIGDGVSGNGWLMDHYEIASIEAADANSFQVTVQIVAFKEPGDQNGYDIVELLVVGPGQDYRGTEHPLIVRDASLVSSSPRPKP